MISRTHDRSAAFTLVELLVVIAIFVLLLAIAVPAFSSMLYSSEQSLADNHLRMGLAAARDAAIRSPQGTDAAAVFFYDPTTGRSMILPCVAAGRMLDADEVQSMPLIDREVFVAAPGFEPVQLPKGWSARGYAPPGLIDDSWYERTYPAGAARQRGNWLFPETGFYDEENQTADTGWERQTFMVRFEGGTGLLKVSDLSAVIVLAPSPSVQFRNSTPWTITGMRVDQEQDQARFVRRVITAPSAGPGSLTLVQKQTLLGDDSCDTVLAKPVGQLALCSEKRLAAAVGVRLDPTTNCLYRDPATATAPYTPEFVLVNGNPWNTGVNGDTVKVNDWVEDHLYNPRQSPPPIPPTADRIESDCRIYTVHRYLGTLQEISGTIGGQGVSQ